MTPLTKSVEIFYSYAHEDELLRSELEKHLSSLQRQRLIAGWHDRKIIPGTDWEHTIDTHLNNASIILLLISPDFMASDYCYGVEVNRAIERHNAKEARVIPILLRPVDLEGALFDKLQVLPTNGKPITSWGNRDEAFMDVAIGIRKSIEEWIASFPISPSATVKFSLDDINQSLSGIDRYRIDWGEAPNSNQIYGRNKELSELRKWIAAELCRIVALWGMGGIGKTSLALTLAEQVKDNFTYVFWRSLQNAPPLRTVLHDCIRLVSDQKQVHLTEGEDGQISLLLDYMQEHRCLVVLDNVESILKTENIAGQYREGCEGFGKLFQRIGEVQHQSCLILTSREKPKEIAFLEGEVSPVRTYLLEGVQPIDGQLILRDKGLRGAEQNWETLVGLYSGNPLALKLVSQFIREVFDSDIASFLKEGEIIFSDIRDILDQQFDRLSALEQEVMYWLAIERQVISLNNLHINMAQLYSKKEL